MKNERAVIGGNNPPDPVSDALAPYDELILACKKWEGDRIVTNDEEAAEVDDLLKQSRTAKTAIEAAKKVHVGMFKQAHTDALALWKPTLNDSRDRIDTLAKSGAKYKKQKAAEAKAAGRKAWDDLEAKRAKAAALMAEANPASLEDTREVRAAQEAVLDADKAAREACDNKPKGLRKTHRFEVEDYTKAWASIPQEYKVATIDIWVKKNHKTVDIGGVKQWITDEAY